MMSKIAFGRGGGVVSLFPSMANRHGLIAGATGTGKTVSLQVLAEGLSDLGVPSFIVDVKGDLSGLGAAGEMSPKLEERLSILGIGDFRFEGYPLEFWDVFGERGLPVRTSISEMGPLLLSKLMDLNEVQTGILNIAFKVADDRKLLLLDIKDLRAVLNHLSDHAAEYRTVYGNISDASIGAILRQLLILEEEEGELFFGEPGLDIKDFMQRDRSGKGVINILNASKLFLKPALYSTFLLWILSEVFEEFEEVGDVDQPRLVLFFDEAHLIFKDIPKALLTQVEQVVRLIRSKGIGVYFITQQPADIPDSVLSQLGNKVQHALSAYTPNELKALKSIAGSFRENPGFNTEAAITELKIGEALVSFLGEDGSPAVVDRVLVLPPKSRMGSLPEEEIQKLRDYSYFKNKYSEPVDRESAYEILSRRANELELRREEELRQKEEERLRKEEAKAEERAEKERQKALEKEERERRKELERQERAREKELERLEKQREKEAKQQRALLDKVTGSFVSSFSRQVGSSLARGLLGTFKKR